MREEILENWIKNGYAVKDAGDGAWAWTGYAKTQLPSYLLTVLSSILYEDANYVPRLTREELRGYGFDRNGLMLEDE